MITAIFLTIGPVKHAFLERSIASVLSMPPSVVTRILVVDNSQSDPWHAFLVARFASDDRVSFLRHASRLGLCDNWNSPLPMVETPWLMYHHDDDEVVPAAWDRVPALLDGDHALVVGAHLLERPGRRLRSMRPPRSTLDMMDICPKYISTIIRTDRLRVRGGWDAAAGHFLDLEGFLALAITHGWRPCPAHLGIYRLHGSNIGGQSVASNYGDHLPHVLKSLFRLTSDPSVRSYACHRLFDVASPPSGFLHRVIRHGTRKLHRWFP
jgi:hypothetical protein